MERAPVCALITYSISRRFLVGGEKDVNRHYRVITVAERAELRNATKVRDGDKTEMEKVSVPIRLTGETRVRLRD